MSDTTGRGAYAEGLSRPFTPEEMAAIRRATRDEEALGRKLFALLGKAAASLPFAEDVLAGWYCARDPATPTRVKAILLAAVGYFVLPVDALPDFLPLFGFTDDAAVVAAALAAVSSAMKPRHREKARTKLADL